MALAESYSQLQTDILNWIDRDDLTAVAPDFITLAERRIYNTVRIATMETAFSDTISSGVIAVPTNFLGWVTVYVDGSPIRTLEVVKPEDIYKDYPTRSSDAKPYKIAREGTNFIFGPYPDSDYTIKGTYYSRLTALSDTNTTNWFTANAPELLLFASLVEAADYVGDEESHMKWIKKYDAALKDLQKTDMKERRGYGAQRARAR